MRSGNQPIIHPSGKATRGSVCCPARGEPDQGKGPLPPARTREWHGPAAFRRSAGDGEAPMRFGLSPGAAVSAFHNAHGSLAGTSARIALGIRASSIPVIRKANAFPPAPPCHPGKTSGGLLYIKRGKPAECYAGEALTSLHARGHAQSEGEDD